MRAKFMTIAFLAAGATVSGGTAEAVPVNYSISVVASGGALSGDVFTGTFTVDSEAVAAGSGSINNLSLNILGTTVTESEDAFNLAPTAQFSASGGLQALYSFVVLSLARAADLGDPADGHLLPSPITSFSISGMFAYGTDAAQGETFLGGAITGQPIPEPLSLSVFAAGLAGLAVARGRVSKG